MSSQMVFALIGGLGFFFYGMKIMSEGLKKIAGDRLKSILRMVTKVPIIGILVGAGITCFIQSSSATSVLVVGFVNAGLLTLRQAISVIMGANIGTTFTAWLVSTMSVFKITHYALPLVGIGFAVNTFGKTKNARFWGQTILGFAILFIGLSFMKDAFEPLKNSPELKDIFATFSTNPLLGVAVGTVFTVLLQSSSATIAIVQVLAFSGVISFQAALPLIIGDNIGTTITAQLAAVGTSVNARRTAMSHTLFNVIGAGYMLFFIYTGLFEKFIGFIIPGEVSSANIMFYIAVSHSLFNVVNVIVFLPLIGKLEQVCIWTVPKPKGAVELGPKFLEEHLLDTPPIAMEQARKETVRMLGLAAKSVSISIKSFFEEDLGLIKSVNELEQAVDNLQSEITQYLVDLSERSLLQGESEELPVLIHIVNDIERIGDHAENIIELAERKIDKKLPFSTESINELTLMWNELHNMAIETETALREEDIKMADSVLSREKLINELQVKLKKGHINRLNQKQCDLKSGIIFLDFVDNLEKIGDHLSNIAQGVKGEMKWEGEIRVKESEKVS
jgi:phosphate:Na+ symporter